VGKKKGPAQTGPGDKIGEITERTEVTMKDNFERVKKILAHLDRLFKARVRAADEGLPVAGIDRDIDLYMNALKVIEGKGR